MPSAAVFPAGGTRLVVFVVYDPRGEIDEHVLIALRGLRPHATTILAVVNGPVTAAGRGMLTTVADEILERPNRGFDVGAQRDALAHIGDRLSEFDEVLLLNDTWFGPLGSFDDVFARMDARAVDFWGLTEHAASDGYRAHLQSFWLAARRSVTAGRAWADYWRALGDPDTYWDAVNGHELAFTEHFTAAGFVGEAAFPADAYPVGNASVYAADLLIADGCPVLKRRPFFHDPTFLARHAIIGADLVPLVRASGYPLRAFWSNLVRTVAPRVLHANAAMIRVLPGEHDAAPGGAGVLAVVQAGPAGDLTHAEPLLAALGEGFDLVVTGAEHLDATGVRQRVGTAPGSVSAAPSVAADVHGTLAAVAALQDLFETRDFRVVIVVPAPPASSDGAARFRHRHALDALLGSAPQVREMLSLFDEDPEMGLVIPLSTPIGRPLEARRWGDERAIAARLRTAAGIRIPWDEVAPLAPDDGAWAARTEVLRELLAQDLSREAPSSAARALLRTLVPAAAEAGLTTWAVAGNETAEIDHTSLEYTMDSLSSTTEGWSTDRIAVIETARWEGSAGVAGLVRAWLRVHHPRAITRARAAVDRVRRRGGRTGRRTDRTHD